MYSSQDLRQLQQKSNTKSKCGWNTELNMICKNILTAKLGNVEINLVTMLLKMYAFRSVNNIFNFLNKTKHFTALKLLFSEDISFLKLNGDNVQMATQGLRIIKWPNTLHIIKMLSINWNTLMEYIRHNLKFIEY